MTNTDTAVPVIDAVAWELTSPSVSGGKAYQIMLVDNYLIVGWGSLSTASRQYKVTRMRNAEAAKAMALSHTGAKEAGGYTLSVAPRTLRVKPDKIDTLHGMTNHRGGSPFLQESFTKVLAHGTSLAA
jgi:hypothetical protein